MDTKGRLNLAELLKESIVRIYNSNKDVVGGGFLVNVDQVLTCAHVITEALKIPLDTYEKPQEKLFLDFPFVEPNNLLSANVVFWEPITASETGDIAGLQLENIPKGIQAVPLVTSEKLWGRSFRTFGFPQGHNNGVWASGVLRDKQATGWVHIEDVKETGYPIQQGFSGCPVWDTQLQGVAGMIVAAERKSEVKAAFIIPSDMLTKSWSSLKISSITMPLKIEIDKISKFEVIEGLKRTIYSEAGEFEGEPVFGRGHRVRIALRNETNEPLEIVSLNLRCVSKTQDYDRALMYQKIGLSLPHTRPPRDEIRTPIIWDHKDDIGTIKEVSEGRIWLEAKGKPEAIHEFKFIVEANAQGLWKYLIEVEYIEPNTGNQKKIESERNLLLLLRGR